MTLIKRKILIDTTVIFDQYSYRETGLMAKELLRRIIKDIVVDESWDLEIIGFHDLNKTLIAIGMSSLAIEEVSPNIEFHSLGEPYPSGQNTIESWNNNYKVIIDNQRVDAFVSFNHDRGLPSAAFLEKKLLYKPKTISIEYKSYHELKKSKKSLSFFAKIFKTNLDSNLLKGLRYADLLILPSNELAARLSKKLKFKNSPVVIYPGLDQDYNLDNIKIEDSEKKEILSRFELQEKGYYILEPKLDDRKELDRVLKIIQGIAGYKRINSPQKFLLINPDFDKGTATTIKAKTANAQKFLNSIRKLDLLSNVMTTGNLDEFEKSVLLSKSFAHLNFGLVSSFNFKSLNALLAGALPVVELSERNKEILGASAIYFDTEDFKNPGKHLKMLLEDEKNIKKTRARRKMTISKYNWEDSSESIWKLIKNLYN